MPEDRVVSRDEGLSLALQLGCEYFETSAKTGAGVEPVSPPLLAFPGMFLSSFRLNTQTEKCSASLVGASSN